jgi:hypothetical protein
MLLDAFCPFVFFDLRPDRIGFAKANCRVMPFAKLVGYPPRNYKDRRSVRYVGSQRKHIELVLRLLPAKNCLRDLADPFV